ncbi:MAG: succinyl-diaminopimelate desuccinylase [Deltaproteobacteria bacterium]|nr:MAG: succinyl-diaminopimelate desuccinylase [Deltaproteobacteria bacterium]
MDLAARTLQLCEIRSPVGEEAEIAAYVARETGGERIGNAVVCGAVSGARPAVLLAGHLDTVPLQEGDFPARRENGRVYGRGASDMKGALAVMIELWKRLDRGPLPLELVLLFYDREEGPIAQNGLRAALEKRPDLRRASFALCLEPTDLSLQVGCCGSMHATLTFQGRSAHSARPWQGENAIHKAGALLSHLAAQLPREVRLGELLYREVMTVTRIEGFTGRNVVPARCDLNLNFRFAPGRSVEEAEAEVQDLARRFGAIATVTDRAPSGPVILDNALLQELRALTAAPLEAKQAWTDVAQLAQAGIPAANFGPGEQAQAHQHGESCPEEALHRAYGMLERFLREAVT